MKKNGFTLIELLAVMVILVLIIGIAIPVVTTQIHNSKKRAMETTAMSIARAIEEDILIDRSNGLPVEIVNNRSLTVPELKKYDVKNGLYSDIKYNVSLDENDRAIVTVSLYGTGSYKGLIVINATRISAVAVVEGE